MAILRCNLFPDDYARMLALQQLAQKLAEQERRTKMSVSVEKATTETEFEADVLAELAALESLPHEEQVRKTKEEEIVAKLAKKHQRRFAEVKHALRNKEKSKTNFTCWELVDEIMGQADRILLWGVSGTGKSWAARRNNLNGVHSH